MTQVGELERKTQNRVVQLFQDTLGYAYLGDWHDRAGNRNLEDDLLRPFLVAQGYDNALIARALTVLHRAADDQGQAPYYRNRAVYDLLRYGVKVKAEQSDLTQTVMLIDWQKPQNNHFGIAEEVTVAGPNGKRPDVVLYVNGIALGVLELKRSTVSVAEGIRQNLDNQKPMFIQPFFSTVQFVMAGNDTEGLRYGVIETPEKYYLAWKEETAAPDAFTNPLDRQLTQMCGKARFLELIHDFLVYDSGVKKCCRANQYFGVRAAQTAVRAREGGIIWHTQGSGKSLTMLWLARWIRENVPDSRVLIITDRVELDQQIEGVFLGVNEQITRCKSGQDLIARLNAATPPLLCSLIHKFGPKTKGSDKNPEQGEADYTAYIAEIRKHLPANFKPKGDVFVFVDECHRTQSGNLHQAMKEIVPGAVFIGFTGTPLLKQDKQKSLEVFGKYIHTYKFNEAVRDKVVLDLRYEARDIDQYIGSPAKIDQWFAAKTKGLNDYALSQLKKRWGTMRRVLSSQSRLERIVDDIMLDMATKDRLQSGRGNALLVSGSIYQACKLYALFQEAGLNECAIVTSYAPTAASVKGEQTGEGLTEKLTQYDIYKKMLNGKDVEAFEKEVKEKFVKDPGQMKLLIVVDKLLTGFDAPPATYLYIDKKMQDHGLFQAICRVNRLDGDDKEYGYVVDYKDLFHSLEKSIKDYTSGEFDVYDKEDVAGLLSDRLEKAREHLDESLESIKALCEPVAPPKNQDAYRHYFCGQTDDKAALKENEAQRHALYKHAAALVRAYADIAGELETAGYTAQQSEQIKQEVAHYEKVRSEVKLASGDYIDLKVYEPAMRHLIDSYINARDSEKLSAFDDLSLIQLIVERGPSAIEALPEEMQKNEGAVAETIENNLRKVIIDEQPTNPKYYEKMSVLLDELIKRRKSESLEYKAYLDEVCALGKQVNNPGNTVTYPLALDTRARRALYDNLGKDEQKALALDNAIRRTKKDGWRDNKIKEREVLGVIKDYVPEEELGRLFDLVKKQYEY